jgi:hypothetical protein
VNRTGLQKGVASWKSRDAKWLLVAYDVPNEPSKFRVKVWRDLRSSGGLYPQMSFCILPFSSTTISKVQAIKSELSHIGKVLVLETKGFTKPDVALLEQMQSDQTERQYLEIAEECQEFLDEIQSNIKKGVFKDEEIQELDESLEGLRRWYGKTVSLDMQRRNSAAKLKVKEMLGRCERALDDYAAQVEMKKKKRQKAVH